MTRLLSLALVVLLGGCASMGAKTFSCGAPEGSRCQSLRQIYAATDGDDYLLNEAADAQARTRKHQRRTTERSKEEVAAGIDQLLAAQNDLDASQVPLPMPTIESDTPLRTRAKVMRVWIAPYEDGRGDLHTPGHVYMEIEPRRWTVGGIGRDARTVPTALQVVTPGPASAPQPASVRPGTRVESRERNQAVNRRQP